MLAGCLTFLGLGLLALLDALQFPRSKGLLAAVADAAQRIEVRHRHRNRGAEREGGAEPTIAAAHGAEYRRHVGGDIAIGPTDKLFLSTIP